MGKELLCERSLKFDPVTVNVKLVIDNEGDLLFLSRKVYTILFRLLYQTDTGVGLE